MSLTNQASSKTHPCISSLNLFWLLEDLMGSPRTLSWCSKFLYFLEDFKRVSVLPTFSTNKTPLFSPWAGYEHISTIPLLGLQSLCNQPHVIRCDPFSPSWICGDEWLPTNYLPEWSLSSVWLYKSHVKMRTGTTSQQGKGWEYQKRVPTSDFYFLAPGSN